MKSDIGGALSEVKDEKDDKKKELRARLRGNPNPGLLSKLIFGFVDPVIRLGRRLRLEEEDLIHREDLRTQKLHDRFAEAWEKEKGLEKPRIARALVSVTWGYIILTGLMHAFTLALQFVGPLMLNRIVAGLSCRGESSPERECPSKQKLYQYCMLLFIAPLLQAFTESHIFFQLNMLGTRLRNSLMAAIYRKCLRSRSSSLGETSVGKIVTLMSADAQKVQDATLTVHSLWGSPVTIVVILVFLYRYVKWSTFVGLAVMFSLGPVTGRISKSIAKYQKARVGFTDKRVGIINEVIAGIRVIKFYAWESSFMKRIHHYRNEEGKLLKKMAFIWGFFSVCILVGPVFVAIACFSSYGLAGYTLTTADVYTALAFFSILRMPLSFLPMFISSAINAIVSLKRIQAFLLKPEAEDNAANKDVPPGLVKVEDGTFTWGSSQDEPTLKDITFTAEPGSLVMVVGSVGSGKSSLLASLIQQIDRVAGNVKVGGSVAYVAQSPWIINETVRENITLSKPFDQEKYDMALRSSQLFPDLAVLQRGDFTEIGERGITLSGGQKQRVSIARAVYADADVYILDDPLSAVDAHVGKALFEDCLTGILANKTIILVSNALQYMSHADKIIWLEEGRIKAMGTSDEILRAGFDPQNLSGSGGEQGKNARTIARQSSSLGSGSFNGQIDCDEVIMEEEDEDSTGEVSSEVDDHTPQSFDKSSDENGSPTIPAASEGGRQIWDENRRLSSEIRIPKEEKGEKHQKPDGMSSVLQKHPDKTTSSKFTNADKKNARTQELTGVEEREGGAIGKEVLGKYVLSIGGILVVILIAVFLIIEQGFRIGTDRWVGLWAEDKLDAKLWTYIVIYGTLGLLYGCFVFLRSLRFAYSHVKGALQLHKWLLEHLLKLPMSFYDSNPSGRIVNRFSRDLEIIDTTLAQTMSQFLVCLGVFGGILVVLCMATPFFIPFILPISIIYFLIQRVYIPSGRELQRLESITRSPIYTQFGETINGVATIRAFGLIDHFVAQSDSRIELNAAAFSTQKAASGWLSTRLDLIGLTMLMLAAVLAVQGGIEPALAGLSLVYALDLTKFLKFGTQLVSKLESESNSIERVVQYLKPAIEGNEDIENDQLPEAALPESWPANGGIKINNISMRYRSDTPLVLRNVSLDFKPGEKIGIAGRTGSGKSSLFLALYRMVKLEEGSVEIDGVDTSYLKLATLRSAMSMIPQDPFMFSGTIRLNLDPFDEYQDHEVWKALEGVGLKPVIEKLPDKLLAPVLDNGGNFSQGQRQLFCLARALLRRSKILLMDEATASVDVETDALIQRTIRENMKETTVLTIAHRINTISDSDRVLVMDDGEVGEFDSPQELLKRDKSLFRDLLESSHKKKKGQSILGSSSFAFLPETHEEGQDDMEDDDDADELVKPLQKSASTVCVNPKTTLGGLDD